MDVSLNRTPRSARLVAAPARNVLELTYHTATRAQVLMLRSEINSQAGKKLGQRTGLDKDCDGPFGI